MQYKMLGSWVYILQMGPFIFPYSPCNLSLFLSHFQSATQTANPPYAKNTIYNTRMAPNKFDIYSL